MAGDAAPPGPDGPRLADVKPADVKLADVKLDQDPAAAPAAGLAASGELFPGVPNERIILLFGLPRSGTTWLAKLFDSHPDVLYRHEPDSIRRGKHLPEWPGPDPSPAELASARAYLAELLRVRTLKSAGSLPMFGKHFRGSAAHALRLGLAQALHGLGALRGGRRLSRAIAIPDLIARSASGRLHIVLKSVTSPHRLGLLAGAVPGCRTILLLRHPCGQVASMLRGAQAGLFEEKLELDLPWLLRSPAAHRHGLTAASFARLEPAEQLAWRWVILAEQASTALERLPRARLVRHGDLSAEPETALRALFSFAGLDWNPQSEAFLRRSTHGVGPQRYYGVFRDSTREVDKWRRELDGPTQRRILAVVRNSSLAKLWPDGLDG